ncbi:hypothetical protein M0805_006189 [Coniferiporia weirii]|nr:hypothetical protein M0805_006189 [Coniferiporia weirii]
MTYPSAQATPYQYEYARPFQPLGLPAEMSAAAPTPYCVRRPPTLAPPKVQYIIGTPKPTQQRSQTLPSKQKSRCTLQGGISRRSTHPSRNVSADKYLNATTAPYDLSAYPSQTPYTVLIPPRVPFPEPQRYLPSLASPPPYSCESAFSEPPEYSPALMSPAPSYSSRVRPGITADDIWLEPKHCEFLINAVREMEICSGLFSTWVEELNRADRGKRDKVEANIISTITSLAEDATSALTASCNIVRSYQDLARLMDRRLSAIELSPHGGNLFASPSISSPGARPVRASDDFQTLAADVRIQSTEISAHVQQMHDRLHGLVRDVMRTHEKYSFRKKFWGWMCKVFKAIGRALTLGGAITALAQPIGLVGSLAMHAGSGLALVIASVCEKIKEAYDDENTKIDDVLKFLRGQIPKSVKVAEHSLTQFLTAHELFQMYFDVKRGKQSGHMAPVEAARARVNWHKASSKLDLSNEMFFELNIDSMSW